MICFINSALQPVLAQSETGGNETNEPWQEGIRFTIDGPKDKRITIPFELVNNLVIIPLRINDSDTMKFILDTGVGTTLITGLEANQTITINSTETIRLSGLGEGEPMEAYLSRNNELFLDRISGSKMELVILKKDIFQLSSVMGTFVHGLIGYDIFSRFVVEINYQQKVVHLYDPEAFREKFKKLPKHRLWNRYPLSIEDRKPYIDVNFQHKKGAPFHPLKLLIDSGSSNAFSFYRMTDENIKVPDSTITTLIGIGLSGFVNGELGRIQQVNLGEFELRKPVVAYPDSLAIRRALVLSDRNGSMGGEVLKRFKTIYHYADSSLLLRSNSDLNEDFNYNMAGLEISTPVPNLPIYVVSGVRPGSPADEAGILPDDVITQLGGKGSGFFTLSEVIDFFDENKGRFVTLEMQRDASKYKVRFKVSDELVIDHDH